jgi:putative membrane protein
MGILNSLANFALFLAYLASGLALLALFARLYLWVTPYDDMRDIHDGKLAPAIALGGAMLGFTFPLLMASYLHANLIGFLLWGGIAGLVQLGVFWGLYRFMPKAIETNNVAGSTCFAIAAVCAGLMNAASFIP